MIELTTSLNFDFKKLKSNKSKPFREFREESLDNVVDQLKDNVNRGTYFKDKPIGRMTKNVRELRGISSRKPLISKGALLKSIKKRGKNIVAKKYGHMQDEGYLINDGKEHGFYAPKKGKGAKLMKIKANTKVEPRPWIVYKPKKKDLDLFMKKFLKYIKVPMRAIKTNKINF